MKHVDAITLKQWLSDGEAIVIDVREPGEHAAKNIPEARLCPLGALEKKQLKLPQNKKIVMHCKTGKRGGLACQTLLDIYPELDIYNLEGGIEAWEIAGFKINQSKRWFLPLDQQVQLTIGVLLVLGSVLAYYVNPLFTLFTGFLGCGLTFAGLTGTCGMAKLIAKMPWNKK
ncbi:MAG: rhodanese-like domain-containing protein [Legionellaceae bacterium]|jgi:rhodanese-related sulfurtransferase|nr:rhodanese-like domain-containing protein [Legionellaceae bacterium]